MGVIHLLAVAAVLMLALVPSPAAAQYFGRNKVEYMDFDFKVLASDHFDVYYYPREEAAARLAVQLAERWYTRFSRILNHTFDRRQPLVLYGSQAEFAQTNVVSGQLSDSIGGVTESSRRRIVMPFAPTMTETNRVLGHEIVHAFQFDIARRHGGGVGQPLWFIEGMAEYLARGATDGEAALWLRDAVLSERLPAHERDAARRLSPYQYGHAMWAYLARRFGDAVVERALKPGKNARKLTDRMRQATGVDLDVLFADWRAAAIASVDAAEHGGSPPLVDGPGEREPDALFARDEGGRMQLGPALSPDGRHAVFFSERDRLSLDLFLAEVATGRVVRKLATTTASARFDSLQALRSAGAWSPTGDSFAFAAVRHGRAALTLIDMRGRTDDREIVLKDLGQIFSPTWSPDGQAIAFSALTGGFTDLYVFELETGTLRQLTSDAFADLHPAWSPDGRSLAFATERFTSDLTTLRFGATQLAILDLASGATRAIDGSGGSQLNPQWSPDGRQLYFVGDFGDSRNVFRINLDTQATERITDVDTGVSGITPTSPALSVALDAPVLAFTVYRDGRPQLATIRRPSALSDRSSLVPAPSAVTDDRDLVAAALDDDRTGLPDQTTISSRAYSPRLSLERIGEPYVSSGGGPFGTFVRGGGSMLFGDMLGERRFGVAVQLGNRMRDAAFEARYLNQERRWNWGALAELEPALRRYRRSAQVEHDGEPALYKEAEYLQRVQLRAAGLVAYPFSRGFRVEFTGGVRHASYFREVRSQVSSLATGRVLDQDQATADGGIPTTVAEISAALVGDTTVFGPTGALVGSRYRFEVAPAIGDLAYTRVLTDYRHYFMPIRPYSFAMRLLHSARYGPDGDDPRLLSSFIGSRYFVRGHGLDARRCQPDASRRCGDELLGSRLFVSNLELRFPLWGLLSRKLEYGPLPADGFIFADGGVVWSQVNRSNVVSSIGAGIRINAGGLPFEVAGVRALDGPTPGWSFDFGFRVGF
jgi:Tol biopolymer transport system component